MKVLLPFLLFLGLHTAYSQRTNEGDVEVVFTNTLWETETLSVKLNPEWFIRTNAEDIAWYASKDNRIHIMFGGTMGGGYTRKDILKLWKERKDGIQSSNLPGGITKAVELFSEHGEEEALIGYAIPTAGEKMIMMSVGLPQSYRAEWEPYFDKVAQTLKIVD